MIGMKRKFYQIYLETERIPFDGARHTLNTFRAAVIQCLSPLLSREVILQPRSLGCDQNIGRVKQPQAEVKWGESCTGFFMQTSVSDKADLEPLFEKVTEAVKVWAEKGD